MSLFLSYGLRQGSEEAIDPSSVLQEPTFSHCTMIDVPHCSRSISIRIRYEPQEEEHGCKV